MSKKYTPEEAVSKQANKQLEQYGFNQEKERRSPAPHRHAQLSETTSPVPESSPINKRKPREVSYRDVQQITERCIISMCQQLDREGVLVAAGGHNAVRRMLNDHLFDVMQRHLYVADGKGSWYPTKVVNDEPTEG